MDLNEIKSKNQIAFENYLEFKRMQSQSKKVKLVQFLKGANIAGLVMVCAFICAGMFNPLFLIGSGCGIVINIASVAGIRNIDYDPELAKMYALLKKEKKLDELTSLMEAYETDENFATKAKIYYKIKGAVARNDAKLEQVLASSQQIKNLEQTNENSTNSSTDTTEQSTKNTTAKTSEQTDENITTIN